MLSARPFRQIIVRFVTCLWLALAPWATCQADILTTLFASNNGQAGNMFDINVLAPDGILVEAVELNLDPGNWNLNFFTIDSTYLGNETNSGAWTFRDSITGLTSAGTNNPTSWDITDFYLPGGGEGFYIFVTNGTAMNYTNGTSEGALVASDANLQIFQGTGNAGAFGGQFRPRIWNGSITYAVVPEPASLAMVTVSGVLFFALGRRCRRRQFSRSLQERYFGQG
jgi:hypothetical protein